MPPDDPSLPPLRFIDSVQGIRYMLIGLSPADLDTTLRRQLRLLYLELGPLVGDDQRVPAVVY